MNNRDLDNLIRWATDTDRFKFEQEIYKHKSKRIWIDSYLQEKFIAMKSNFIKWIAELDDKRLNNLADAINSNPTNEVDYV